LVVRTGNYRPVSMMWALKVTRSTMAATSRGRDDLAHSLKGRLLANATADFSSLSVNIWNSSSDPRCPA